MDLGSGGGPAATAGKTSWTCPGPGYTGDANVPGTDTQDPGIPGTGPGCAPATGALKHCPRCSKAFLSVSTNAMKVEAGQKSDRDGRRLMESHAGASTGSNYMVASQY